MFVWLSVCIMCCYATCVWPEFIFNNVMFWKTALIPISLQYSDKAFLNKCRWWLLVHSLRGSQREKLLNYKSIHIFVLYSSWWSLLTNGKTIRWKMTSWPSGFLKLGKTSIDSLKWRSYICWMKPIQPHVLLVWLKLREKGWTCKNCKFWDSTK